MGRQEHPSYFPPSLALGLVGIYLSSFLLYFPSEQGPLSIPFTSTFIFNHHTGRIDTLCFGMQSAGASIHLLDLINHCMSDL